MFKFQFDPTRLLLAHCSANAPLYWLQDTGGAGFRGFYLFVLGVTFPFKERRLAARRFGVCCCFLLGGVPPVGAKARE